MDKVRWGLLSTANINRRLIPAIRASKRGELAAVASRDQVKAQAYADQWQIPRAFGSYEEMLASDAVDAVYVSLPNHLHAEWTIRALQAGKHVLCEKPFAVTVEEVDQMIAASRASQCSLAEAFMYRHHPQTKILAEWLKSGRLGEIRQVSAYFGFLMTNAQNNVRMVPEYGGGALWDVGIYPISFAQLVMGGLPEWVDGAQWMGDTGVDEDFAALIHYSGNRNAQIGCSFHVPYQAHAEVIGSTGRITLTHPFNNQSAPESQMTFFPDKGDPQKLEFPEFNAYLGEVEDLHDAVLDHQPQLVTLEETRKHIQVANALLQSANENKRINL